jgi:hypothetical protein
MRVAWLSNREFHAQLRTGSGTLAIMKRKEPRPDCRGPGAKRVMTNPLSHSCKIAYPKCADIDVDQEQNAALVRVDSLSRVILAEQLGRGIGHRIMPPVGVRLLHRPGLRQSFAS